MLKFKQILRIKSTIFSFASKVRYKEMLRPKPQNLQNYFFFQIAKNYSKSSKTDNQSEKDQLVTNLLDNSLETLRKSSIENVSLFQRAMLDLNRISVMKEQITKNKENCFKLIQIVLQLRKARGNIHIAKKENNHGSNQYEINLKNYYGGLDLTSNQLVNVVCKANIALRDLDLLFETIFYIPKTYKNNLSMQEYLDELLKSHKTEIPLPIKLLLLQRILPQTGPKDSLRNLVSSIKTEYDKVESTLFDIGMMNFIYLENKFQRVSLNKKLLMSPEIEDLDFEHDDEETMIIKNSKFQKQIEAEKLNEKVFEKAFIQICKFEQKETEINDLTFFKSMILLFSSISAYGIKNEKFLQIMENYILKYQNSLKISEKLNLLIIYFDQYRIIPKFAPSFEQEFLKALEAFTSHLRQNPSVVLQNSPQNDITSSKEYYGYLKNLVNPNFTNQNSLNIVENEESYFSLQCIIGLYWYLGKTNTGDISIELIQKTNSLINNFIQMGNIKQMFLIIHAACCLSLTNPKLIDWENDIKLKAKILLKGLEKNSPERIQFLGYFYKTLLFLKLQYNIDINQYLPQDYTKHFKKQWLNNLNFKQSRTEDRVYSILKDCFKNHNITRNIQRNVVIEIAPVDIFIEPNIIIEVNGPYHFPLNSSFEISKNKYLPDHLLKSSIFRLKGYKLINIDLQEHKHFTYISKDFEAYIFEKIKEIIPL